MVWKVGLSRLKRNFLYLCFANNNLTQMQELNFIAQIAKNRYGKMQIL